MAHTVVDPEPQRTLLCTKGGFTYLILMFTIVLMGITITAAAKQWKTMVQREKEADLLARGIEIQNALAAYSAAIKRVRVTAAGGTTVGGGTTVAGGKTAAGGKTSAGTTTAATAATGENYPMTLAELTNQPKPFLRKAYKDPMTGGDWDYIRDPLTGRIKGVKSRSILEPIKQSNFPPEVRHFEGMTMYDQWVFQHPSLSTPQAVPGTGATPGATTPGASGTGTPGATTPGTTGTITSTPGGTQSQTGTSSGSGTSQGMSPSN